MFVEQIQKAMRETGGCVCVGLDPVIERLPDGFARTAAGVESFLEWVVAETVDHACVYKPNSAFFEALGSAGFDVLGRTIERIHAHNRTAILDAKRGDIASTAEAYAAAAFGVLKADAITLVPYMGDDAMTPFLDRGGFAFVLALPSNPSARSVVEHGTPPLYLHVAESARALELRYPAQVGLVVGATRPEAAARIRDVAPGLPWLVPGIGAQGGSATAFFEAVTGRQMMVVNASRSILFAERPGAAARELKETIKEAQA
jgi:orotidine 5'-phosphate decarboxylase subfamily 2